MPQVPFEDEGGDPPCWAHLFETPPEPPSNALLAQLVCDLADAVVISDTEGVITFWNDAAGTLFGWSAADAVGRALDTDMDPGAVVEGKLSQSPLGRRPAAAV